MSVAPGIRLGPYEVVAPIGAGGMGEVYRARDTRLDRTVAIKVLPAALAADPALRERFEREARAVSSLQHPHICALFDVGRDRDTDFLVLEYLDGETLADRLTRVGALGPAEALKTAIEICDALAAAHRAGIVHRDLKPANVMLTRGGAKLLDFGLAKAAAPVVATSGLSMLPTTPPNITQQGTILGTFQYMAPEQIEGLEADARTDIFAFGALLFEMLTGRAAFEGKTRASLLGSILKDQPPPVSQVQPTAPPPIDRIVATCLAKDPDDRYQSARDLLRDLQWIAAGASPSTSSTAPSAVVTSRASRLGWLVAGAATVAFVAAATVALRHLRETPPSTGPIVFVVAPPSDTTFSTPPGGGTGLAAQAAISPDGRSIVFVGHGRTGYRLWLRAIDSADARPLPGTDDAAFPFWSPDSRHVGYFASGKLKRVAVGGGSPITVCDAQAGRGGAWNRDNVVLFAPSTTSVLMRVSATGGTPTAASTLDTAYGETAHRFPSFLPDGRHFLYTAVVGTCCPPAKPGRVKTGQLDSMESSVLQQVDSVAAYASGRLLFARGGTLLAAPFDPDSRKLTGEPATLSEDVGSEGSRYASFSASETGVLVYAHGVAARPTTRLTWFDRSGRRLGTVGDAGEYSSIALAPDEQHIAVGLSTATSENRDIWVFDLERGSQKRVTFDPGDDTGPVWSPDGRRIAFQANRNGAQVVRQQVADGAAPEQPLIDRVAGDPRGAPSPTDWSADGRYMLYNRSQGTEGSTDIWALPLFGDRKPTPILQTPSVEVNGRFSPDGHWFAYSSNQGGLFQVYVQPFPSTGAQFQVSKDGGNHPEWRRDGKELLFLAPGGQLMATAVDTSRTFESGTPTLLFTVTTPANAGSNYQHYAVTRDGTRILANAIERDTISTPLTVVANWLAILQK